MEELQRQQGTVEYNERRKLGSPSQEEDVVLWIRALDITKIKKKKC